MPGVSAASGVAAVTVSEPAPVAATRDHSERERGGVAFAVPSPARSAAAPRRAAAPSARKLSHPPKSGPALKVRVTEPDAVTGSRTIIIQSDEGEVLGPYLPGLVPVPSVVPRERPTPKPEGRPEYLTALYTLGGA